MMNRIGKALSLLCTAAVLSACSVEVNPDGNLAQDINISAANMGNAKEDGGREDEEADVSEESNQANTGNEGVFCFVYEGAELIPGESFDKSALGKYSEVSEVPSCAFGGNDNVYNYEMFELTTYIDEDVERVYSIYFIDSNLSTTEGLCLGDTVDDMESIYGKDYEEEETACTYTRGETLLCIITRNGIVVSIEYRLDR